LSHYKLYPGDTTESMAALVPTAPRITAYSQTNDRWAAFEYWPGYTLARYGCLICSYAMVASQLYYSSAEPPTFARKLRDVGAISAGMVSNPARIPLAYPALEWSGAVHWRKEAADMSFLNTELMQHGATIVELAYNPQKPVIYTDITGAVKYNTHFCVLTELTGDDGMIIDPIDGITKSLRLSRYALRTAWGASRIITGCRLLRIVKVIV